MATNLTISRSQFFANNSWFPRGIKVGQTYKLATVIKAITGDARFLPNV